jgi:eukaryotic-like serine/threonine-protein kinase
MDQSLLILGEPGSGKTTLLLELARDLLDRAEGDASQPIPVVFPLSTWAESRKPLVEWLQDELSFRYDVPRKIAQEWVGADQVLPLLDGLDEVKAAHRAACVQAVNAFRQSHGLLRLVVTSRTADYEALAEALRLQGAILVQPLTREQVNAYLTELGRAGEAVGTALHEDSSHWELMDSPLMLFVITVTYAGQTETRPPARGTVGERRDHLFGSYVDQVLRRRAADNRYTPEQTTHWLSWLAGQMANRGQTVFCLERLQIDWFPVRLQWAVHVRYGLVGGLVGLVGGLIVELIGLGIGLIGGLGIGLGGGLLGGLTFGEIENRAVPNEGIRRSARNGVFVALFVGVIGGVFGALVGALWGRRDIGPFGWLGTGLFGGLVVGLFGGLYRWRCGVSQARRTSSLAHPQRLYSVELCQVSRLCRRADLAAQGRRRLCLPPPDAAGVFRSAVCRISGREGVDREAIPYRSRIVSRMSEHAGCRLPNPLIPVLPPAGAGDRTRIAKPTRQ